MKHLALSFGLILVVHLSLACQCEPHEPNFYKNLSSSTHNCIAVFDTVASYFDDGNHGTFGRFVLIDTFGFQDFNIGDTIVVIGQDGINCAESLHYFDRGDTIVLALYKWDFDYAKDTFYLEGACGKFFLKISNGHSNGLSIPEIKNKIQAVTLNADLACRCYLFYWTHYEFYHNISSQTSNCLAVFQRFDYGYEYNGLKSQTGYFVLIDTIGEFNSQIGDTIVIIGEDGINCGEMLNRFSSGDTLFLALTKGYYESFYRDTFYLEGGTCGYHYLRILNGQNDGLSISEIKNKIISIITNIQHSKVDIDLLIHPNPTANKFTIISSDALIDKIQIIDMKGRLIQEINQIHRTHFECDISNVKVGLYVIKIFTDRGMVIKKVIKK